MDLSETAATDAPILFVTRKWAPATGGMETYSLRLTEALGDRAEVIALPGRANGMPPGTGALLAFPFTILRRYLARRTPQVLHAGDMALWPVGLLAGRHATVALSAHGTDVAYHRRGGLKGGLYGLYLCLGARMLRKATVIANSRATAEVLGETGWRNVIVVPLATDMAGSPSDGRHDGKILFAGRLIERKGCGWFIRNVLSLLPETIALQVAGTKWDSREAIALEDPRVEYLGTLDGPALAQAYRNALCVVVPNIETATGEYEGFGLVAAEAAAAGGLVLAADHGGLTDAVIDGETGMLVKSGDATAWRDAIAKISGWSREERQAFLWRAQSTAVERYSWTRVARETVAAYDAALRKFGVLRASP
jgi:glycosyltransferase involved in cell wall biosynthesis